MPRYYFHTDDGDITLQDEEGFIVADAEAARYAAIDALPDIARDQLPDGDHRKFTITVEDERHVVIYMASLEFIGEWKTLPPK